MKPSSALFWVPFVPPKWRWINSLSASFSPPYVPKPPVMTRAALNLPYGGMWVNNIKKEEEKGDLKLLRGGKKPPQNGCFLLQKQESGREAIRWSLLQGKRVNIFGPKNPEVATVLEWTQDGGICGWKLGVYVCGVPSQDPQERGSHTHRCSQIFTPGPKSLLQRFGWGQLTPALRSRWKEGEWGQGKFRFHGYTGGSNIPGTLDWQF